MKCSEPFSKYSRYLWLLIAVTSASVFSLPLIFLISANGSYLPFSHESIAFRYFNSLRILGGEGGAVWTPQGQITNLIQLIINWAIERISPNSSLIEKIRIFSIGSTLTTNVGMLALYLLAIKNKYLTFSDKASILLLGPTLLLGTTTAGFYYFLLPDYYAFSILIITGSVFLSLYLYRKQSNFNFTNLIFVSAICGIAASNKITLIGISGISALIVIFNKPISRDAILFRIFISAVITIITFLSIFLILYLLNFHDAWIALKNTLGFLKSTGAEPRFWSENFWLFQKIYNYRSIFIFWVFASIYMVIELSRKREYRGFIVLAAHIIISLLLTLGLYKRGAGTTFFEVSCILGGLSAIVISIAIGPIKRNWAITLIPVFIFVLSIFQFNYAHNWMVVDKSKGLENTSVEIYNYLLDLKRPIEIIIPDDSYNTAGIEDLINKGLRDFLTLQFSGKSHLKESILPNSNFNTSVPKIYKGTSILWVEKWDFQSNTTLTLSDQNEWLKWEKLIAASKFNTCKKWRTGYSNQFIVNICQIDIAP